MEMLHRSQQATTDGSARSRRTSWRTPTLVAIVLLVAIYGVSPNFRWSPGPDATPYAGDFIHEWLGGYIFREGPRARFYDVSYALQLQHDQELLGYDWDESQYFPIVYPPFYYVIVSPLSYLSLRPAAWLWAAIMVASLAVTIQLIVRHLTRVLPGSERAASVARRLPWFLPMSLLFMPLIESLNSSQKGTVILLIFTATFILLDRKRPFAAGAVFGLLAFKPQLTLVVVIAMLGKRQWRFFGGCVGTGVILLAMSFAVGIDVCSQFVAFSRGAGDYISTAGYDLTESHCWYGFFTLMFEHSKMTATWATCLAGLATVGVVCLTLREPIQTGTDRFSLQFSGLVMATLLMSPHVFTYDLTVLLLPMALVGFHLIDTAKYSANVTSAMCAVVTFLFIVPGFSHRIAEWTHLQLSVVVLFGSMIIIERACASLRTEAPSRWTAILSNRFRPINAHGSGSE